MYQEHIYTNRSIYLCFHNDTYCKLRSTKTPKSGVPNDLPKELLQEFSPELASPVNKIMQNIGKSYKHIGQIINSLKI